MLQVKLEPRIPFELQSEGIRIHTEALPCDVTAEKRTLCKCQAAVQTLASEESCDLWKKMGVVRPIKARPTQTYMKHPNIQTTKV